MRDLGSEGGLPGGLGHEQPPAAAGGPDPGARIRAGLAYLSAVQGADGGFPVVVVTGGPGFPSDALSSPFVTGLVVEALHGVREDPEADRLIRRAVSYLRAEMEDGGLWRFYRCDPPLRRDLDSTTAALRALRGAGLTLDYGAAADRLRGYRTMTGRFRTWVEARPSLGQRLRKSPGVLVRRWFNPVDPVVNANVLAFLHAIDRAAPRTERHLLRWARSPGALGPSPYYLYPECLAYALSKAAAPRPPGDALRAAAGALVGRLLDRAPDPAGTRPFLLARRLAAAFRLGLARPDLPPSVATLASHQRADGSWPWGAVWTAARWAPGAPRPLLGSPALDTTLAIEVLSRWRPR